MKDSSRNVVRGLDSVASVHNGGMRDSTDAVREDEFFSLAERFRRTTDPEEIVRLADQLGRIIFG